MRKISKLLAVMILCLASFVLTTACGVEIESATVKTGTLNTTVVKGDVIDTSKVIVIYTYSDDTTKEVEAKDLTFSTVDTSKVTNNAKLTITYGDYSFDVKIRVRASIDDVNEVSEFSSGDQTSYRANAVTTNDKFYNAELGIETRYVGTDNALRFDLIATGYDGSNKVVPDLKNISTTTKVELIEGAGNSRTYTLLTEETETKLSDVAELTNIDASIKFKPAAVGKDFRVTIEPVNKKAGISTLLQIQAELHVVEGFNVHEAKELAVYDNSGRDYDQDGTPDWNSIKEEIGVAANYTPTNIILQNNITIEDEDIPTTMFWHKNEGTNKATLFNHTSPSEGTLEGLFNTAKTNLDEPNAGNEKVSGKKIALEGSMVDRDYTGVYHRLMADGKQVNFIGNYFHVSAENLSRSVVQSRGSATNTAGGHAVVNCTEGNESYMEMHMTLFCHEYNEDAAMTQPTTVNWKNISFSGNGAADALPEYSGSIILEKSYRVSTNITNCYSNYFAINYLFHRGESDTRTIPGTQTKFDANNNDGNFVIDHCKGYNSYQALLFMNGAENATIKNSEFKKANGPAIITVQNNYDPDEDEVTYPAHLDIIASDIESIVSGQEPWFQFYQANTVAMQLTAIEGFFNGMANATYMPETNKTMIQGTAKFGNDNIGMFNLLVIMMREGAISFSALDAVTGYTRVFKDMNEYNNFYKEDSTDTNIYGLEMDATDYTSMTYKAAQKTQANGGQMSMYIQDKLGRYFEASTVPGATPDMSTDLQAQMGPNWATAFENVDWLNLYIPNGMGAMIELVERD